MDMEENNRVWESSLEKERERGHDLQSGFASSHLSRNAVKKMPKPKPLELQRECVGWVRSLAADGVAVLDHLGQLVIVRVRKVLLEAERRGDVLRTHVQALAQA